MISEENKIWIDFCSGDPSALEKLYKLFYPVLLRYGKKFTTDPAVVEDEIHNLFLSLWQTGKLPADLYSPKAYLLRSLRNRLLDQLRMHERNMHQEIGFEPNTDAYIYSIEDILIQEQAQEEDIVRIRKAMEDLPPRQREIIYLRYYSELSLADIAQVMSLTYQSVRNLLHKAFIRIRELLQTTFSAISLIMMNLPDPDNFF